MHPHGDVSTELETHVILADLNNLGPQAIKIIAALVVITATAATSVPNVKVDILPLFERVTELWRVFEGLGNGNFCNQEL